MNNTHLLSLAAALAAVPFFATADASAGDPCSDVPQIEEQIRRLFAEYGTLDNKAGQARKPIVKQQIIEAQARLDAAKRACAAAPPPSNRPGDRCSPQIANNAAAASVCGPVCERQGLVFAGNWSNDRRHPPVKTCIDKREGSAVCGCSAKR